MEGLKKKGSGRRILKWRYRIRAPFAVAVLAFFSVLIPIAASAQIVTTYSYDSLQRLTGTSVQGGSSTQYAYDANGNLTSVTSTNASSNLAPNQPLDVDLSVPGRSATLTFSSDGSSADIYLNSISTSPPGSSVTVAVYNSSGTLISSTSGTSDATLALSGLAAGTYTVVITPPSSGTASLQVSLAVAAQPDLGGAPLPLWAYLILGVGLIAVLVRIQRHSAAILPLCIAAIALGAGTSVRAQGLPASPIGTIPAGVYWGAAMGSGATQHLVYDDGQTPCARIADDFNNAQSPLNYYRNPRVEYLADYGWGCEYDLQSTYNGQWSYNAYFQHWV